MARDDTMVELGEGALVVVDLARDLVLECAAVDLVALVIPRHALALPRGDASAHRIVIPAGSETGHLLAPLFGALAQSLADDAAPLGEESSGLLLAAIAHLVEGQRALRKARLVFDRRDQSILGRMCRYIETEIANPALGASLLVKQFAVSRATVYRVFAPHGGVAGYIRDLRLDQAFEQIRQSPHPIERLNMLARRFGFLSADSFARAFHARFGIRPTHLHGGGSGAFVAANRGRLGMQPEGRLAQWLIDLGMTGEEG